MWELKGWWEVSSLKGSEKDPCVLEEAWALAAEPRVFDAVLMLLMPVESKLSSVLMSKV